jgi:Glycyl-tRNA synthetase, beta subunit
MINEALQKKDIAFKSSKSFSTPQRLVFLIDGIPEKKEQNKKTIKGPKTQAPKEALEGFIKSNNLNQSDLYKKKIDKGEFYFAETKPKIIDVLSELKIIIPEILKLYSWKKSMKWSIYELNWGRPLKSITALFNKNIVDFNFFHLKSTDQIQVEGSKGNISKKVNNFQSYKLLLKTQNIILDHNKRKEIIVKKMENICKTKNLKNKFNEKLIEDVVNLVEKPNIIIGKFDEEYLKIPQEILIITMQQHQKYFPLFDTNDKLTNIFLLVANLPDSKGYIKIGNQRSY